MRDQAAPGSRGLFAVLFELLLEGGKLGERRIGIGLFVTAVAGRTVGLGVVLLALGTIGTVLALAPRTIAIRSTLVTAFTTLLTIAANLPVLPIRTPIATPIVAPIVAPLPAMRLFGRRTGLARRRSIPSGRRGNLANSSGRCRLSHLRRMLRTAWTPRTMRAPLGAAGGPPDFDECRLGRRFSSMQQKQQKQQLRSRVRIRRRLPVRRSQPFQPPAAEPVRPRQMAAPVRRAPLRQQQAFRPAT